MMLKNYGAKIYVPDNNSVESALEKTTHMAVAAHPDDIEIFGYHGILECYQNNEKSFFGTVVTSGSGTIKRGVYKDLSDKEMQKVRMEEQINAATIGQYSGIALLNYESSQVNNSKNQSLIEELANIVSISAPQVIYTHNLADKHSTHVGVAVHLIHAIRTIPQNLRPKKLFGCEVWRCLDWVQDDEKVILDVSGNSALEKELISVFDSQISTGKKYDLATLGRRLANATFSAPNSPSTSDSTIFAMDLTPLINDSSLIIQEFIKGYISRFEDDVINKISKIM